MKFLLIQEYVDGFRNKLFLEPHLKLNAILDLLYNKHYHRDDIETVELCCVVGKTERVTCLVYLIGSKRFLAAGHLSPDSSAGIRMCNAFNKLNKKYFGEDLPPDLQKGKEDNNSDEAPLALNLLPVDEDTKKQIEKIIGTKPIKLDKEYGIQWLNNNRKQKGGE